MIEPEDKKVHIRQETDDRWEVEGVFGGKNFRFIRDLFNGTKEQCQIWCDVRCYTVLSDKAWEGFTKNTVHGLSIPRLRRWHPSLTPADQIDAKPIFAPYLPMLKGNQSKCTKSNCKKLFTPAIKQI